MEAQLDTNARPLRADAARNRASVLAAARRAFAEEGLDADMASIAERADVGVGTVYRHFPTKEALLSALASDHFAKLAEIAETSAAEGGTSWDVVERMVWRTAGHSAGDHGMCEVLARASPTLRAVPAAARLRELSGTLVQAAVDEGSVRADATADDIPMMMCGFGKIAALQRQGGGPSGLDWRRYLTIMLDGLRAR